MKSINYGVFASKPCSTEYSFVSHPFRPTKPHHYCPQAVFKSPISTPERSSPVIQRQTLRFRYSSPAMPQCSSPNPPRSPPGPTPLPLRLLTGRSASAFPLPLTLHAHVPYQFPLANLPDLSSVLVCGRRRVVTVGDVEGRVRIGGDWRCEVGVWVGIVDVDER